MCDKGNLFISKGKHILFKKKFKTITPGHRKIKVYGIEKNQHG